MRTYSHAVLTYATTLLAKNTTRQKSLSAALGATTPDAPMLLGAAWLWTKRKAFSREDFDDEVCGRTFFREPDAALHSALSVLAALAIERVFRGKNSAFTLGWAGHALSDFLTHGEDARPVFWPLSKRRFRSPVSYREREKHGRIFTIFEHGAAFAATLLLLLEARKSAKKADG